MGKYIVRNGVVAGRKFRLEAGARIVLGREKGDLNFPDQRMSRTHCALEVRDDGDYIEDANSTNGTFVNEEKVKLRALKPGDIIRVGFTELEYLGMPEHVSIGLTMEPGQPSDPNKTIAFRRGGLGAAAPPGRRPRPLRRSPARSKMDEVKRAAMGIHGGVKLISAKGKFCEACGEAIFMKEGAPDEGRMLDGLYLCRMCALIAEKQKDAGGDYLPSYAKIVGGRVGGEEAPTAAEVGSLGVEIASVDEISLDELGGGPPPAEEGTEEKTEESATGEKAAEEQAAEEQEEQIEEGAETKKDDTSPHRAESDALVEEEGEREGEPEAGSEAEPRSEDKAEGPGESDPAAGRELSAEDVLTAMDAAIEATGAAAEADVDDEAGQDEAGQDEVGEDEARKRARAADSGSEGGKAKPVVGDKGPILPDDLGLAD